MCDFTGSTLFQLRECIRFARTHAYSGIIDMNDLSQSIFVNNDEYYKFLPEEQKVKWIQSVLLEQCIE